MKTISIHRWLVVWSLLLGGALTLPAQDTGQIVIIQKIRNDDGTVTVLKKNVTTSEALEAMLPDEERPQKAFLGIYPEPLPEGAGVRVDGVIARTGAAAAGLLIGDVLTAVDEQALTHENDLSQVLARYQPGDQVLLSLQRNGEPLTIQATLGSRATHQLSGFERDPCQVFIGVSVGENGPDGKGTVISGIIDRTPAEAVGLRSGDVILALDDVETNSHEALLRERNKHQPGDWFILHIQRDGQVMDVEAQFKACDREEPMEPMVKPEEELEQDEQIEPIDPVLNIDHNLALAEYAAYPNPTYGEVHIRFQAEAKPTTIRISDPAGKVVFEEYRPDFDGYFARPVDLSGAQHGLLLLTIQQEDRMVTKKLILLARA